MKLIARRDKINRLAILPEEDFTRKDLSQLQVLDRQLRNAREVDILSGARGDGHPVLMTQILVLWAMWMTWSTCSMALTTSSRSGSAHSRLALCFGC